MSEGKWDADSSNSSMGDVDGPASSTDNAVARFDSTTGKIIQNSGVIIDDSDNVTGVTSQTIDGSSTTALNVSTNNALVVDSTNARAGIGRSPAGDTYKLAISGTAATDGVGLLITDTFTSKTWTMRNDSSNIIFNDGSTNVLVVGDGNTSAIGGNPLSGRTLHVTNSATTTAVNLTFTNGSSGQTATDGTIFGIDNAATPNAEIVNFEASDINFKTNNITGMALDSSQNFALYGGNSTNGGTLDLTNVTTGTGSSVTFDALRFLDASGAVITGPLSGDVFITMVDGAEVKTIMYRYLNTGDGTTNQVANLADQAQTGTNPWSSTAVVADGSGVKIQLTTSAGRTSVTTICRFVGVRGINA